MHNIIHDGTHNPEHPEFELHYRAEFDMADFDDGKSSYEYTLTNNYYRITIYPIVETKRPEHFLDPMRMCIYFDGGNIFKAYPIEAFIIPDKPVPHEPELSWLTSPYNSGARRYYNWYSNEPVPADFYHAAMTLIEADKLVRKMYPGYCLILNRPKMKVPDKLPEPGQYILPPHVLRQEKARKEEAGNPSK